MKEIRIIIAVLFMCIAVGSYANAECIHVDDSLLLDLPCVEYGGNNYSFKLDYYPNPNDPAGIYWKMDINSFREIYNFYTDNETEPNDVLSDATLIGLNKNVRGKIGSSNDKDYFKITTSQAGVIEVAVNPVPSEIRMNITVYDEKQNVIASKLASEYGQSTFVNVLGSAGVHYILLSNYYSSYSVNDYNLLVTLDTFDSYEVNNSFYNASLISVNTDINGKIRAEGDKDYFKFTVADAGVLKISVDPMPSEVKMHVTLYDGQQNVVAYRTAAYGDSIFFEASNEPGTYYIKLNSEYSYNHSDEHYTLRIEH